MKNFLQNKSKILFLCLFIVMTCTACSNPRGTDGKTKLDEIISSEKIEIQKGLVNVDEIEDQELAKEYAKLKDTDMITIEPTSFTDAMSDGWFDGLIVWPIAQIINTLSSFTDSGVGIILTTLLIQIIVFLFTRKSQMSSQRMQEIQPEMQKIQDKYKDKTDDRSKMMMYQETQKLYQKYDIHPFGSMLVMFIQLPIMMGMYYATMRAASVVYGSFFGLPFSGTPMDGFRNLEFGYIIIYVLMIVFQLLALKMPQILKKMQDKKDNVKHKKYAESSNSTMNTMNTTMYFTTAMIAFLYISWPIAMSFYYLVTSVIRTIQAVILHFVMNKKK